MDCSQVSRDIVAILSVSIMGKILPKKKTTRSSVRSHKLQVGSHIDNVKHSLEHLIFSKIKEEEVVFFKKRLKFIGVALLLLVTFVVTLSPEGKAEVATFYPTACLGGWVNPSNAEGEPQTTSNTIEDIFTKENSAVLPSTTNADMYCGNFKGKIEENTKPIKILVSFAWNTGRDITFKQEIIGSSFASSSGEILDTSSSTEVSFTFSSSTEAVATSSEVISQNSTTTSEIIQDETSLLGKIIGVAEDVIEKAFEENKNNDTTPTSTTPQIENVSEEKTLGESMAPTEVIPTPVSVEVIPEQEPVPTPEPAPAPTPAPEPTPVPVQELPSEPVSFLQLLIQKFAMNFVHTVFAEEVATSTEEGIATNQNINDNSTVVVNEPEIITEVVVASSSEEIAKSNQVTQDGGTTTTVTTLEIIKTESENEAVVIFEEKSNAEAGAETILGTSTVDVENAATTTESASTTASFASSSDVILDKSKEDSSSNNFLEVLYTFDGIIWKSLGKVNESSMKYRTFEIPLDTIASWDDMSKLQIKVQPLQRIDATPAVYLDGIKIEVLYETPIVHIHPDFNRDTILQDEVIEGVRIIRIINIDTNKEETWYMYLEKNSLIGASTTVTSSTGTQLAPEEKFSEGSISATVSETEAIILSTTTETSIVGISTTTVIREKNKNTWFKYEGDAITPTVSDIADFEKLKIIEKDSVDEKIDVVLDLLPDFISERIKRIKGSFLGSVIIQVKGEKEDELWLYNIETETQEKINVGSSTTVSSDFPFGIKGGFLFWLSQDKSFVYAYNPITKVFFEKEMPTFNPSEGERAEISFEEIRWKIIVNNENFTFFSNQTGEVFSDEDSQSLNALRQKINLDGILNEEKLNKLDFSLENLEETPVIGE